MKPLHFQSRRPVDCYEFQKVTELRLKGRSWQDVASAIGRSLADTKRIHDPLLPVIVTTPEPEKPPVPEVIDHSTLGLMSKTAQQIAERYGITLADLKSPSRLKRIVHARHEFMAECAAVGRSTPQIGEFLDRDHSTVIHGVRAHKKRQGAA